MVESIRIGWSSNSPYPKSPKVSKNTLREKTVQVSATCQPRSCKRCCGLSGIGVKGLLFPPGLTTKWTYGPGASQSLHSPDLSRRVCKSLRSVANKRVKTSRMMAGTWPDKRYYWRLMKDESRSHGAGLEISWPKHPGLSKSRCEEALQFLETSDVEACQIWFLFP